MALSSPEEDKDKGAGLEILNLKVEEEDLSYGGTEIAVSAVDQAKSDGEGSVDLSSTCEDEETSDEEVEPLVGEEIQEGTEASVCPGNADTGLVYPEAKKEEEDVVEVDSSGSIEVPFPGEFLSNTKTEDSRGKLRFSGLPSYGWVMALWAGGFLSVLNWNQDSRSAKLLLGFGS
ncbi:hypothetical protein U1Q18_017886 [Sarracenia purpurea var. burkii]